MPVRNQLCTHRWRIKGGFYGEVRVYAPWVVLAQIECSINRWPVVSHAFLVPQGTRSTIKFVNLAWSSRYILHLSVVTVVRIRIERSGAVKPKGRVCVFPGVRSINRVINVGKSIPRLLVRKGCNLPSFAIGRVLLMADDEWWLWSWENAYQTGSTQRRGFGGYEGDEANVSWHVHTGEDNFHGMF